MKEKLKNRILGLGIFALVFSLNLFFAGSTEAKQAAEVSLFSQAESGQQQSLLDSFEPKLQAVILHKTELNELHQQIRKFPAAPGLLFLLLTHIVEEKQEQQTLADTAFSPSADLLLTLRKLRI